MNGSAISVPFRRKLSMTIQEKLVADAKRRLALLRADRNTHTFALKEVDPEKLVAITFLRTMVGLGDYRTLVEITVDIGSRLQQLLKLPKSSAEACQFGWFGIVSFLELGILSYRRRSAAHLKHPPYALEIVNQEAIDELWETFKTDAAVDELFPSEQPLSAWSGPRHSGGFMLVKKADPSTIAQLRPRLVPKLFDTVNKLGARAQMINKPVLEVFDFFLQSQEVSSPVQFSQILDTRKRRSKQIEYQTISQMARRFSVFYHLYNVDFRGRVYNNTAFLNEFGCDAAKAIILSAEPAPLGPRGYFWLKVHVANTLGHDKLELEERANWVDANLREILSWSEDPTVNTGWFSAPKPWSALAGAFELKLVSLWLSDGGLIEDYPCYLPIYIDGTVSGSQHLAAMLRDEQLAPFVNLVPSKKPGDLYSLVATKVWHRIDEQLQGVDQGTLKQMEAVMAELDQLTHSFLSSPYNTQERSDAWEALATWKNHNRHLRELLFPVFWSRVTDPAERRKLVKRVTMTLGYGVTRYGASQQVLDDAPSVSSWVAKADRLWLAQFGALVYDVCRQDLSGLGKLLSIFETLAERANNKNTYLSWSVPVTGFPVVQRYRQPQVVRTKLSYGRKTLKVQLEAWEEATLNQAAQKAGASPNIVHSLDAAHLMMIVSAANFPMFVIHDSFGCTPGNMEQLFHLVREKFVELYQSDPLTCILKQLDSLDLLPEFGNLDLELVKMSPFAFS